jgi:hypothetical protein
MARFRDGVEVKPVNAALDKIQKDLDSLTYFVSPEVSYQLGVELVYGNDQVFWHRQPEEPARRIL